MMASGTMLYNMRGHALIRQWRLLPNGGSKRLDRGSQGADRWSLPE